MKRVKTASVLASLLVFVLTACGGKGSTTFSATSTLLSWEGEDYSGEYGTTLEGLSAGDPVVVAYDVSAGSVTIELSHGDASPYSWRGVSGSETEVVFVSEGGDWQAKMTLADASGSVRLEAQEYVDPGTDAEASGDADASVQGATEEGGAQTANPWRDAATLSELDEIAGFYVGLPEELPGLGTPQLMQAIPGELAQVRYGPEGRSALVRKGTGEDVAGDFDEHAYVMTEEVAGYEVDMATNDGDAVVLATWRADDFAYCVAVDGGLPSDEMAELVTLVMG